MAHIALCVDDDKMTLIFLEQALLPLGVEILQAEDGYQALSYLEQYSPAILFLDILLPVGPNGLEILNFIANTPRLEQMLVVVASAHDGFKHNPEMGRADLYFVKPLRLKDVRASAQQAIERQS